MGVRVKLAYLDAVKLIERLHRQFLEVVKAELDRLGVEDINNVQGLILFNIGSDELTVGELTNRGYYLGSNVSYNVRKMVENGYLVQERSPHDKRSIRVRLSDKGLALSGKVSEIFDQHGDALSSILDDEDSMKNAIATFRELERLWMSRLDYSMRAPLPMARAASEG